MKNLKSLFGLVTLTAATSFTPEAKAAFLPAPPIGAVVVSAGAAAAASAAAAGVARHRREALSRTMVNPVRENIDEAISRDAIQGNMVTYIEQARTAMSLTTSLDPSNITEDQRNQFVNLLETYRLVAQISAKDATQAVALGMNSSYVEYFEEAKAKARIKDTVSSSQAAYAEKLMGDMKWERKTKPALQTGLLFGVPAGIGIGLAAAYISRRRNDRYPY